MLYSLNYSPLIEKIFKDLNRWAKLPLFLIGRCHLIKMSSYSLLLYPMQTLRLLLKHNDIKKLNSVFVKFIWAGKRPRIALSKLMLPKEEGGLNFPNIRGYNLSCLSRYVLDWFQGLDGFTLDSRVFPPM